MHSDFSLKRKTGMRGYFLFTTALIFFRNLNIYIMYSAYHLYKDVRNLSTQQIVFMGIFSAPEVSQNNIIIVGV